MQPVLHVGQRLLVVEVVAGDEALDRLARDAEGPVADALDLEAAPGAGAAWRARLGNGVPVVVTSSATGQGLDELRAELLRRVPLSEPAPDDLGGAEDLAEHRVFRPAARRGFEVERVGDGAFRVTGEPVERLIARHDLDNEDALAHVERRLHRMGVVRALEGAGFEPGDDVEIAGVVFELDPG